MISALYEAATSQNEFAAGNRNGTVALEELPWPRL
jgi:hypothetical protein